MGVIYSGRISAVECSAYMRCDCLASELGWVFSGHLFFLSFLFVRGLPKLMNLGCVCEIMNARNPLTRVFMASLAFHFSSALFGEKKVNMLAAVFLFLEKKYIYACSAGV